MCKPAVFPVLGAIFAFLGIQGCCHFCHRPDCGTAPPPAAAPVLPPGAAPGVPPPAPTPFPQPQPLPSIPPAPAPAQDIRGFGPAAIPGETPAWRPGEDALRISARSEVTLSQKATGIGTHQQRPVGPMADEVSVVPAALDHQVL